VSASIFYQPVKGKRLSVGAPSAFLKALREAFNVNGDLVLSSSSYGVLQGLKAGLDSQDMKAAIEELMAAVETHDEVRVWAEY
jgi:hypothetical protein